MQDQLNYIVQKLDKMDEKQDQMAETLVRNTLIVEQHERRSTSLEAMVQSVVKDRVVPLETHVAFVKTASKIMIKIAVAVASIATTVLAIWAGIKAIL